MMMNEDVQNSKFEKLLMNSINIHNISKSDILKTTPVKLNNIERPFNSPLHSARS